jgi:hypothetical protein
MVLRGLRISSCEKRAFHGSYCIKSTVSQALKRLSIKLGSALSTAYGFHVCTGSLRAEVHMDSFGHLSHSRSHYSESHLLQWSQHEVLLLSLPL